MRILLIRTTNGVSGAETHNISLFGALAKERDIDVHVLTNHEPFLKRLKRNHIPSSFIPFPIKEVGTKKELIFAALWFFPMLFINLLKVKSLEQKGKFDTMVLESMTEKLFLTPYLKLLGYRVVWIEQGPVFRTNRSLLVKKLYVYKSKWPDAILAVSEDTKEDLIKGGVDKAKIHVVHIGIEKEFIHSRNWKFFNSGNGRKIWTIGFLGSVTKEKGIEEFMDIAKTLIEKHTMVRFLIIGGGPLLAWVKAQIKNFDLQKQIECTGYVDDIEPYLRKIDILFFPTRHQEGISLALLEALAAGKLVVARDIGGNRELVIDKKTGFLFQRSEDEYRILEKIVNNNVDVRSMVKSATQHIRNNFLLSKQLPLFIDIFHG